MFALFFLQIQSFDSTLAFVSIWCNLSWQLIENLNQHHSGKCWDFLCAMYVMWNKSMILKTTEETRKKIGYTDICIILKELRFIDMYLWNKYRTPLLVCNFIDLLFNVSIHVLNVKTIFTYVNYTT